jgi:hypothetical protein
VGGVALGELVFCVHQEALRRLDAPYLGELGDRFDLPDGDDSLHGAVGRKGGGDLASQVGDRLHEAVRNLVVDVDDRHAVRVDAGFVGDFVVWRQFLHYREFAALLVGVQEVRVELFLRGGLRGFFGEDGSELLLGLLV